MRRGLTRTALATFWRKIHVFGPRLTYSKIEKPRRSDRRGDLDVINDEMASVIVRAL
jgi:hypothetical protein